MSSSSSRKESRSRLDCPLPDCGASLGRKADLIRHQEEKHGEMEFCSQPGCNYEGTKRSLRLKAHMEKRIQNSKWTYMYQMLFRQCRRKLIHNIRSQVAFALISHEAAFINSAVERSASVSSYTQNPIYPGYTVSYSADSGVSSTTSSYYNSPAYALITLPTD